MEMQPWVAEGVLVWLMASGVVVVAAVAGAVAAIGSCTGGLTPELQVLEFVIWHVSCRASYPRDDN